MSVKAVKWALRSAPLNPTKSQARDRLVLTALANYHSNETGKCYPSASTLADELEIGLSGVRRALKSLEGQGLISRTDQSEVSHIRAGSRPVAWHLHLEKNREADDENYFDDPVSGTPRGVHVDTSEGHRSNVSRGVHTDTSRGVHVETQKGNLKGIVKGENPPVVPPRGDAPAPAKTEPATPSKEIEPAKRAVVAAPRVDDEFVEWYAAYPRKTARKAAERAYKAARRSGATQDELLAGLERSKRSWAVEGRSKDKLPYPATWLNQGRWEDEETTRADVVERPVDRQETFMDVADRMIARMEMGTAANGWGELE